MTKASAPPSLSPGRHLRCHRKKFARAMLVIIVGSALCLLNYQQSVTYLYTFTSDSKVQDVRTKRILFWVPFFDIADYYFGLGRKPFARCPVSNCETTTNRSMLPYSDAIVFHFRDTNYDDLPTWRSPSQRWVFFLMESPENTFSDLRQFSGLFNWTMTYRLDSDVVASYAYVLPVTANSEVRWNRTVAKKRRKFGVGKKRRLASWLVSHCRTAGRREDYVAALHNYASVDIFGKCYGRPCENGKDCLERVLRDYKFYLSFENSICSDYVTEKFFKVLDHDTVPVVFGGADYGAVAPPHSYINVNDFPSPRHLADFLKMLDKNNTLYREYFQWKSSYWVDYRPNHFCNLCAKLHRAASEDTKVYQDIYAWWMTDGNCTRDLVKANY